MVPLVLLVERWGTEPPLWLHALLWLPLSVALALYLLPRIKGAVIALLWAQKMARSQGRDRERRPLSLNDVAARRRPVLLLVAAGYGSASVPFFFVRRCRARSVACCCLSGRLLCDRSRRAE